MNTYFIRIILTNIKSLIFLLMIETEPLSHANFKY